MSLKAPRTIWSQTQEDQHRSTTLQGRESSECVCTHTHEEAGGCQQVGVLLFALSPPPLSGQALSLILAVTDRQAGQLQGSLASAFPHPQS